MGIGTVGPLMSQIARSRGMEPRAANDVLASASIAGIVCADGLGSHRPSGQRCRRYNPVYV